MPRHNSFVSQDSRLFMNPASATISPTDMQRVQRPMYPSDISNIAGVQQPTPFDFAVEDPALWGPYASNIPTVDPSCILTSDTSDIQPWLAPSLSPPNPAPCQLNQVTNSRKPTTVDTQASRSYRVKHGQVTPPSDESPASKTVPSISPQTTHTPYVQSSIENLSEDIPKRRRGGGAPRTRGGSIGASVHRGSSLQSGRGSASVEPGSPGDDKQEKTRARNRLAASKCRQKRKLENSELENKYEQEKQRNEELHREVSQLRASLVATKDMVLAHSACHHDHIQAYIQSMAKKITINDDSIDFSAGPSQFYGGPRPGRSGFGFDH
ncbi:hypothetical protein BJX70DRAFT_354652 [Aspergillus crustosus]